MTPDTQNSGISLDEQIEMKQLDIIRNRQEAGRHADGFKESALTTLKSTPVKIGAGIVGLLLLRSLSRGKRARKNEQRHVDRRRTRAPSKLTLKNVITVATTSLALMEKLKRKEAEVEKNAAHVERRAAEIKYQTGQDVEPERPPYH